MNPNTEDLLRTVAILRTLSPEDRVALAAISRVRLYTRGERIFEQGSPSDFLPIVVRGRVKVVRHVEPGRDIILHIVEPGDLLGAVAVAREIPFPASADAMEDCVLVEIPCAALNELVRTAPSVLRGLLAGLTYRLVELTDHMAVLSGTRVEPRFARLFLKLAEETGVDDGEATRIPLRLSRQELADLTGTTVETAIRIMSRWGKEGTLATDEQGFLLRDRAALQELAQG